jgi:hypothetical protein
MTTPVPGVTARVTVRPLMGLLLGSFTVTVIVDVSVPAVIVVGKAATVD